MAIFDDVERAIKLRDVSAIVPLLFTDKPLSVKSGFRSETELWDFKNDCPPLGRESLSAWAEISKDVLGFHNKKGGVLIFGINDKDYSFNGVTVTGIDSKLFNDKIRIFLGDRIWVDFHREFIQKDQRYIGLALIPPRGPAFGRFISSAPLISGKRLFAIDDSAIRDGDSTRVLSQTELDEFIRKTSIPTIDKQYEINESFYRILSSEYFNFIERKEPCTLVEKALRDSRTTITSINGIGGVGKTALATWAVLRAYDKRAFDSIISITAKDRELTSQGIRAIDPKLTTFESMLNNILDVLGFPEAKRDKIEEREAKVRGILEKSNTLLYIDNLETVDDARILTFLEDLPIGVRAIITSRRPRVRKSVFPIDLGGLTEDETVKFISSLKTQNKLGYVGNINRADCILIGSACNGIPLAIRWILSRSTKVSEALKSAENITKGYGRGQELLEFCFRRVFEEMPNAEKTVLEVLSLFQRPIPHEPIIVGANFPAYKTLDALDSLVQDALVQRFFDPDINDYSYALLPITRTFVYDQVIKEPHLEEEIRKRMSDWFEARDVKSDDERIVVRELRQGKSDSESGLLDLAIAAERRGDFDSAEDLYNQTHGRNPRNFKAARLFAEFLRHKRGNIAGALQKYSQAAANAPSRGQERAIIFREWGMTIRDSGDSRATDSAIEKFEIALIDLPQDVVTISALAQLLDRKGIYSRVITLLEPIENNTNRRTQTTVLPLLLKAYEREGEMVKAAQLKEKLKLLKIS